MSISAEYHLPDSPPLPEAPVRSRALHWAVWGVQILLALLFGFAGVLKMTSPMSTLAGQLPWTTAVPEILVRLIGVAEVVGALGLIVPALTRIEPRLTALAAIGLVTLMSLATLFHLGRGEWSALPVTVVVGALAAFVGWARFKKVPLAARPVHRLPLRR